MGVTGGDFRHSFTVFPPMPSHEGLVVGPHPPFPCSGDRGLRVRVWRATYMDATNELQISVCVVKE
jgi:hypothetical protein